MPYCQIPGTGVSYALIAFDRDGRERPGDPDAQDGRFSDRILADATHTPPTHVFFFSHGWMGDLDGAKSQYNSWISAMLKLEKDRERMGPAFHPLWIGLHWPSLAWGQENFGQAAFDVVTAGMDSIKRQYAVELGDTPEVRDCLEVIFREHQDNAAAMVMPQHVVQAYSRLAESIGYTGEGPGSAPEAEGKPFDPEAAFEAAGDMADFGNEPSLGPLLWPLRQLTFWTMKRRARTIGEGGMHDFIARLQDALPRTSFHLMGHSFGCVIVSSVLGGKNGRAPLPRPVESLVLVQGALSLWAYADHIMDSAGRSGYFNPAFRHPAVRGPVVVTRSRHDSAVGTFYPLAVALVLANPDFAGDDPALSALPLYGGIGAFGIRGYAGVNDTDMLGADGDYRLQAGQVYNVNGDRFIPSHVGIDGPEVAHLIWQAAQSGGSADAAGTH